MFKVLDVNLEGCTRAEVLPCCRSQSFSLELSTSFVTRTRKPLQLYLDDIPLAITNMESATRDPLVDLERHRLRLEENVAKLRKSLLHWQTWELEYEGLKEEIQLKGQPTTEDIVMALVFAIGPTVLLT